MSVSTKLFRILMHNSQKHKNLSCIVKVKLHFKGP